MRNVYQTKSGQYFSSSNADCRQEATGIGRIAAALGCAVILAVAVLEASCAGNSPPPGAGPSDFAVGGSATGVPGTVALPTPGPVVEPRQLTAETEVETAWKATISVPASFYITEGKDVVRIQDPDREVTLSLVAVDAEDRKAALAAAWKLVDPAFSLAIAQDHDLPGREGWDAMGQTVYVTKTEDQRLVVALARRKGNTWHVAVIDGKVAAVQRRGAQLNSILLDMKVPGLDEESFAGKTPVVDRDRLARFEVFVEEARVLAGVPGASVAMVHGGKIVLEKGYGVRSLGGKQKVTPSTLFQIGSTTKAFTTLLLARLIDDGKLTWETPVTQLLPDFALADADTTAKVQVRHLVCACTGMPRQDLEMLFEYAGWDPERRLASMKTMKPTTGFGETFQYSNLMVAASGWLAGRAYAPEKKLGPAYDEAMQKLVFAPLGMNSTTVTLSKAIEKDHADTHARGFAQTYEKIPVSYEEALIAVRPAGAIWSTARDMARYMLLELGQGTLDGKPIVSEQNLLARRQPQVKIDEDNAYGLGLVTSNYHGVQIVHHGGNTLGHTADMFVLPEHGIGVVVLANGQGANSFTAAVRRAFFEIFFDGKPEAKENLTTAIAQRAQVLAEEVKLIAAPDAAWIDPLLGTYENADLGTIKLARKGKAVVFDAGEWKSEIGKKTDRDGVVKLVTTKPPYVGIVLLPKQEDGKTVLVLDAGQQVYTFTPRAAKK